jgi:glycerol-3-phosphate dehydrogenase
LVKGDRSARTASLSRDHVIRISPSGLITIAGGKWTTVRKMAEDCVDQAIKASGFECDCCRTMQMQLHGATSQLDSGDPRSHYGTDLRAIEALETESPALAEPLHESLAIHKSDIMWAVRHEMARTVEDVLARRTRALFLDAHAAIESAPEVAKLMAGELGRDKTWCELQVEIFKSVANHYMPP